MKKQNEDGVIAEKSELELLFRLLLLEFGAINASMIFLARGWLMRAPRF